MIKINEDSVNAELYIADATKAHAELPPLVVTLGGSGGGFHFSRESAQTLAGEGYASLATAYFGLPGLPEDLREIPLEYFSKAWRIALQKLNSNRRVVIVGRSRGAELALLLGATFPEVCGVIAYAPGHVRWSVFSSERRDGKTLPSWTYADQPLASATMDADLFDRHLASTEGSDAVSLVPWFKECLANSPVEAEIPVERINGPILMMSGTDDLLWPSCEAADAIESRLRRHGFRHGVTNLKFSGAGHCFDLPTGRFPLDDQFFYVNGRRFAFGGHEQGTLHAQSEGWREVVNFLNALSSHV